jgi:hypothetical protein
MSSAKQVRSHDLPEIATALEDPPAYFWLKDALRSALARDPVDAANDAEILCGLLAHRSDEILARS